MSKLDLRALPTSRAGVAEVRVVPPKRSDAPWLLLEVPHGATTESHYRAVERQLVGPLPKDLIHFFHVNTDIGAPEGAEFLAESLSAKGFGVATLRCEIPRTFIDTNRVLSEKSSGEDKGVVRHGLTAALPAYIQDERDWKLLSALHQAYVGMAEQLYQHLAGTAQAYVVQVHSFAPRTVGITVVDASIVDALHSAYEPEVYATWPQRPIVDLICRSKDGTFRPAEALVARVSRAYARAGIPAKENATYSLEDVAMGTRFARAYPARTLCIELNRGAVAAPFVPFGPSTIDKAAVARLLGPVAEAIRDDAAGTPI